MALPATDQFTAANGTPLTTYSPNWTYCEGSFAINANAVHPSTISECGAGWNVEPFDPNQYAEGTIVAIGPEVSIVGIAVRCDVGTPSSNYYCFYGNNASSWLGKMVDGVWDMLGDPGPAFNIADRIRLEAEGTLLTAKINGGIVLSETDASLASGAPGLSGYYNLTDSRLDDWEGGNLAGGPVARSIVVVIG